MFSPNIKDNYIDIKKHHCMLRRQNKSNAKQLKQCARKADRVIQEWLHGNKFVHHPPKDRILIGKKNPSRMRETVSKGMET